MAERKAREPQRQTELAMERARLAQPRRSEERWLRRRWFYPRTTAGEWTWWLSGAFLLWVIDGNEAPLTLTEWVYAVVGTLLMLGVGRIVALAILDF